MSEKPKIYKKYKYPDGRVLELTKEEFEQVVDVMRVLINSKRKRTGHPLLMTPATKIIG
jgi:hypothetical protein